MLRTLKIFLAASLCTLLVFTGGPVWFSPSVDEHFHLHFSTGPDEAQAEAQKYTCSMHPFIIRDEPGNCPICGMTLTPVKIVRPGQGAVPGGERKVKHWASPTDPGFTSGKPGKTPSGEELVPVYEEESAGGIIIIDPVTQQNMGVRLATVSRRDMSRAIRTVGLVGHEEPRQYSVNSKIDGWIERLYANETGSFVKKGQPLLEIYSPELVTAQEEFLLALRNKGALAKSEVPEIAAGADRLLEASRKRLRYWDISEEQIKTLEKTGTVTKTLTYYSRYDGVLRQKKVNQGMFVKAGVELFQIVDISKVWVYADIYEYELPWLKVGQTASIDLPYHHEPLQGRVSTIYPYVEAKTRTVKARIDLDNPDFKLKPDMYVNVRIEAQVVKNVLSIPVEAVFNSGERQSVFVSLGEGKFEPRLVKLGLQGGDGVVQIVEGLLENERIVVSGQFMLDSESTLRAAMLKMMEPEKEQPDGEEKSAAKAEESLDSLFEK
ncbi:MAG: efflux RND transporter periplasmic adaptor subunit [Desulfobulbaceae bacterium]